MRQHELKTWPRPFQALVDGRKTFEWRQNDRDFREGDTLFLREWCPERETYTGRATKWTVTYMLTNETGFGVPDGFVVLALGPAPQ